MAFGIHGVQSLPKKGELSDGEPVGRLQPRFAKRTGGLPGRKDSQATPG